MGVLRVESTQNGRGGFFHKTNRDAPNKFKNGIGACRLQERSLQDLAEVLGSQLGYFLKLPSPYQYRANEAGRLDV